MAQIITIEKGNTLGGIASRFNTTVEELQRINPNITDPNLIIVGEQLNVPEVFQGAVPQGVSEDIFRATGATEPITSATLVPTADIPVVSPTPTFVPPALTPTPPLSPFGKRLCLKIPYLVLLVLRFAFESLAVLG